MITNNHNSYIIDLTALSNKEKSAPKLRKGKSIKQKVSVTTSLFKDYDLDRVSSTSYTETYRFNLLNDGEYIDNGTSLPN